MSRARGSRLLHRQADHSVLDHQKSGDLLSLDPLLDLRARQHDLTDLGFYLVGEDGEKFITSHSVFEGFLITTSYHPDVGGGGCGADIGNAFLFVLDLATGGGFFDPSLGPTAQNRRLSIGKGVPSSPSISVSTGSTRLFVQTSGGSARGFDGPNPDSYSFRTLYWRQDL